MTVSPDGATFDGDFERPAPPAAAPARRGGRAIPFTIALASAGIFAASLWYAYYQGTRVAQTSGLPPLVSADPAPTKLRPDEPGGLQVPNQDKLVYQRMVANQPDKRVERLLPPPEAPVKRPEAEASTPPQEVNVSSTNVVPPQITEKQKPPPIRSTTLPNLKASSTPATASAAPPAPTLNTATSKTTKTAAVPTKTAAPTATKPKPVVSGPFGLQLASLKKPDGASREWRRLQTSHSVLAGLSSRVARADLGAKGVYFRIVAGPFKSRASADKACRQLKAKNQGCLVVKY